jgi:hypothetical protein
MHIWASLLRSTPWSRKNDDWPTWLSQNETGHCYFLDLNEGQ